MGTVRRLYLFAVSFITLELILWGLIGVLRAVSSTDPGAGDVGGLLEELSLLAVGAPVFGLHWWLAQREARQDEDKRSVWPRAVFLYGVLLATLIPLTQNALALFNRSLLQIFGLSWRLALIGGGQTWRDNLIAIGVNALIGGYFFSVLRGDWAKGVEGKAYLQTRRIYRYLWVIYTLGMGIGGVQLFLEYWLVLVERDTPEQLANGLALMLVGIPLGIFSWWWVQRSLERPEERRSLLRLVALHCFHLVGLAGLLVPGGMILETGLLFLLERNNSLSAFTVSIGEPLSTAITFGAVWVYFGRVLRSETTLLPTSAQRVSVRRLFSYLISLLGLGATLIGAEALSSFVLEVALEIPLVLGPRLREQLSSSVATLLVGMILWVFTWRALSDEATQAGEAGDYARRSLIRKTYLYLALFAGVMGVTFTAGALINELLRAVFENPADDFLGDSLKLLKNLLLLFGLLLVYHGMLLRDDRRRAERWLAARHERYPVLVLAQDAGAFTQSVMAALQRETPSMPVAVHLVSQGAPDEILSEAEAVILPAEISAQPPEAIRLWLKDFSGHRLVVPLDTEGWSWVFPGKRDLPNLAREVAKTVRQLAEEREA